MVTEPYPVGTIVNYHGSLEDHHGDHRITASPHHRVRPRA